MKNIYCIFLLAALISMTGCSSQRKIAYFNGINSASSDSIGKKFFKAHEAKIVSGDMLSITVSGLDPLAVAPYNLPLVSFAAPGSSQIYNSYTLQSYLVDVNGDVNFPVLGSVRLGGMTKSQAINYIQDKLSKDLKNPIVTIQFLNYKITVLGEVLRPGLYSINNERVSILEALGLAGDMTVYGKRENVLLFRESDGKPEFVRLNLNTDEIFKSPYFYLQQNDVLYVEPNVVKSIQAQNLPLYLSTLSTLATVTTVIIALYK